jgi:hypothetical protein
MEKYFLSLFFQLSHHKSIKTYEMQDPKPPISSLKSLIPIQSLLTPPPYYEFTHFLKINHAQHFLI